MPPGTSAHHHNHYHQDTRQETPFVRASYTRCYHVIANSSTSLYRRRLIQTGAGGSVGEEVEGDLVQLSPQCGLGYGRSRDGVMVMAGWASAPQSNFSVDGLIYGDGASRSGRDQHHHPKPPRRPTEAFRTLSAPRRTSDGSVGLAHIRPGRRAKSALLCSPRRP